MTAMVDALYYEDNGPDGESPREDQEKLLFLFEAMFIKGSEAVMTTMLVKIIDQMQDNIYDLQGMELVMYCKKDMVVECFQDDTKWSEVEKSIKQIKW